MKTVILHGLGQTPRDWDSAIGLVPSLDVDCPGLFSLVDAGPLTYSRILERLEARYAGTAEPLQLCGLSLGAVLALDYTIRHPNQVRSLILIAGQFRSPKLLIDVQNLIFRCMPAKMFGDIGLSKKDATRLTHSLSGLDLAPELERVACPVMVVCGEKDRTNQKAAKKLAALLPQAELRIIPGAGHQVNLDAPEAIAELLKQ